MKHCYFSIVCFFVVFIAQAQIVNIPDSQFKLALLQQNISTPIDTNSDGEIQVTEAQAVTEIHFFGAFIINDFTGIQSFPNLIHLRFTYGAMLLDNIDLSGMSHLETFEYPSGSLNTLNLSGLTSLQRLVCDNNSLDAIDLSGLTNLKYIDLSYNAIDTLNLSGLTQLEYLDLNSNFGLIALDVSPCTNLKTLKCNTNQIASLNINGLTQIEYLDCYHNILPGTLNMSNNLNLNYLNCSGNQLTGLNITGLNASLTYLNCEWNQLSSLNVVGFNNLIDLNFGNNTINTIDLSGLSSIENLKCIENAMPTINVNALTTLKKLNCSNNLLTTINVDQLVNLIDFNCSFNLLSVINVNMLIHLTTLDCSDNQITNLPISNLNQLTSLNCGSNLLTALDISNAPELNRLSCYSNQLTNLDTTNTTKLSSIICSNNLFSSLDFNAITEATEITYLIQNNPLLTYVNTKNGTQYPTVSAAGCLNLRFICADEMNINSILSNLNFQGLSNVQINSYCSFVPGGHYNTITGKINLDLDNNGCDPNDYRFPQIRVGINDGINSGASFTNISGDYTFFTQAGNFSITPQLENAFFTISPLNATLNFNAVTNETQTQNFCITPLGVHKDVEITIIPLDHARPGFDANYSLAYKNKGNQILSGSINLTFDDAVLDFVSATPNTLSQAINSLNWDYANLIPFESRSIEFTLNVNAPTEIPAVNINDILHYTASISPISGDETIADNDFSLNQTVTGSFDPNDKTCLEGNTITPEMVGNYLHYLIRFQNSGTAAAENVVVKDIIDTNKFDISSLQLTSTSHPQVTKITGNKVEFQFQNINLPAEIDDEPGSHGYIAFKIKTKNNLVIGNSVSNKADIYFDYNFPIETNTATSTVALLGLNQFENTTVTVAPNPTKNAVRITSKGMITSVQLFDVQGRILETQLFNTETVDFSLSQKNSGVYFIKIITEKGVKTEKIIKE